MVGVKSSFKRNLVATCAAMAALSGLQVVNPPPALADSLGGFMGGFFGGFVGGMMGGGGYGYRHGYGYRNGGGGRHHVTPGAGAATPPSQAESSNALASLAPPTTSEQSAVLKRIVPVAALGSVGATDDLQRMTKYDSESDRDYTALVEDLAKKLTTKPDDKSPNSKSSITSDITQHSIMEALDNSIRDTQLIKFETFRDESWSPERLRVMIIDRVEIELGDALDASKRVALTMHDVDVAFAKAARSVQARLFESSELLAANRNSTQFLLRLYQTHGDVSSDVRERIEQLLQRAAAEGVAPFEALFLRDPNGYALHYRGERIVYDCLTENIETISSGESGMATEAEIEKRINDINHDQCMKWVAAQLVGADGVLKAQEPVPLRVVWSADGPRTDPSMFSRAPDEL